MTPLMFAWYLLLLGLLRQLTGPFTVLEIILKTKTRVNELHKRTYKLSDSAVE